MQGFVNYPRRDLEAAWSRRSVQFLNDPRVSLIRDVLACIRVAPFFGPPPSDA